jgi:trimethylamine---corrinoid protein Co-methyltransferase
MTDTSERRRERRARHAPPPIQRQAQITYTQPVHELLGPDGVQRIHAAAMRILAEFGIDFYDEEARAILAEHGATVRGQTVFFDEALVMQYVAKAPAQFVQRARNPANDVVIGGDKIVFSPVYGPPFVQDLDGARRDATLQDFQSFIKLAYLSPWMHHSGGTVVEPMDEPVSTRHLDMVLSHITYSDKAFMGSVTSGPNAADSVAMAEIVFGAEAIREHPALLSLINVSSPRRYDDRMLAALKVYARARQALLITPFILAGAMGPASIGGSLAQLVAEALAGIALVQMIEPGCPVVFGSFFSTMDLQSGALTMGTPEAQLALYAAAEMARSCPTPRPATRA